MSESRVITTITIRYFIYSVIFFFLIFFFRSCNNVNFARRSECNRCGCGEQRTCYRSSLNVVMLILIVNSERPGGKPAFGGDNRGGRVDRAHQLAPGDWLCPNVECGNKNWKSKGACNRCGTREFFSFHQEILC